MTAVWINAIAVALCFYAAGMCYALRGGYKHVRALSCYLLGTINLIILVHRVKGC